MLVTILAILGAIVLTLIIMYVIMRYIRHSRSRHHGSGYNQWPPRRYMQVEGQRCPDYWQYVGDENGNFRCRNTFNLPVPKKHESTCYNANTSTKEAVFEKIRRFPNRQNSKSDKILKSRCDWIKNCGTTVNEQGQHVKSYASWEGVDKFC